MTVMVLDCTIASWYLKISWHQTTVRGWLFNLQSPEMALGWTGLLLYWDIERYRHVVLGRMVSLPPDTDPWCIVLYLSSAVWHLCLGDFLFSAPSHLPEHVVHVLVVCYLTARVNMWNFSQDTFNIIRLPQLPVSKNAYPCKFPRAICPHQCGIFVWELFSAFAQDGYVYKTVNTNANVGNVLLGVMVLRTTTSG